MNDFEKNTHNESGVENQEKLKKILLIEDEEAFYISLNFVFKKKTNFLHASTLDEAKKIFNENPDIDLIMVDGCLNPNGELDTPPFVKMARENGFKGKMIAMSSSEKFNKILIEAGCDESCKKHESLDTILSFVDPYLFNKIQAEKKY